jgi:hypothetical protein
MLGWDRSNGNVYFSNSAGTNFGTVSTEDLVDGQFHDYRVRKSPDAGGQMVLQAYLDGNPAGGPVDYASLSPDAGSNEGFGYFSASPTTGTFIFDEVRFGPAYSPQNDYQAAVLANNPLVYYPFEESSTSNGSVVKDASGQLHDGSYQGGTVQVQGPHGVSTAGLPTSLAPDFDGSAGHVSSTELGSFGSQLDDGFSVEFWINTEETRIRRQGFGSLANNGIVIDFNRKSDFSGEAGATNFFVRDSSNKDLNAHITADIYDGKWHHVAWVVDDPASNQMQVYVDGALQSLNYGRTQSPSNFANFSRPLGVGALIRGGGPENHLDGSFDEVAIYNRGLSEAEIRSHLKALPEYRFSYDGTYATDDPNPPLTQTTWSKQSTGNLAASPNEPELGFARLNDNSSSGRITFLNTFDEDVSGETWVYEARLKFDAYSGLPTLFGVRDEGGNGKTIMLGLDSGIINPALPGALRFFSSSAGNVQLVNDQNLVDGEFHTFRVEKYPGASGFEIQVLIDGEEQFATRLPYSMFPDDSGNTNGFGWFNSTPGTADVTLDYFYMGALVPEPSSLALALLGMLTVGLATGRRRRRAGEE